MRRFLAYLIVCVSAAYTSVSAQDGTVIRVDYVALSIHADGTETPHAEGVRYIATDGRHRHDETSAGGEQTSSYWLPPDGIQVSVNHALRAAVRSGLREPAWNPRTSMRFVPPIVDADQGPVGPVPPTQFLGTRALGPILLHGYAYDLGSERIENWVYEQPMMQTAVDPFAYPPIPVEMTIFMMGSGERFEVRATSVRRALLEADTFRIPYPVVR